jgi:hypothetical protein
MAVLFKNAKILLEDGEFQGCLGVKGDLIDYIGKEEKQGYDRLIDATGCALIPGLINAHTHLPMTVFRNHADDIYSRYGSEAEQIRPFPKEALSTLLPMLETEEDIDTLRDVICAIAEYQELHSSITAHIAALHTHPDSDVRFTVTTRLSLDMENPVAQQALRELARDEDAAVAEMARQSLSMLEMRSPQHEEEIAESE